VKRQLESSVPALRNHSKLRLLENSLGAAFSDLSFVDRFSGTAPGRLQVCVLGVLRQEKGQDVVVDLAQQRPNLHFHLIGRPGPNAEQWLHDLKARAPANVTFHGHITNIPQTLETLRIQVNLLPSTQESFGLAAIEGMACSCLTVVSGQGGLWDVAEKTGALIAGTPEELAATLDRVSTMPPAVASALTKQQFEATMAHYHPSHFQQEAIAMFQQMIPDTAAPG
jgi:glycosyltransferase involved in cell wall biosynthesis